MRKVETLGEAWEAGWSVSAVCHGGMIDLGPKSHKKCDWKHELDMPTLLAAKGRKFPVCDLAMKVRCPRCGILGLRLMFYVPTGVDRKVAR